MNRRSCFCLHILSGMMITITTGLPTCRYPQEAEEEAGGEVILTPLIIMVMKTITITMDTIITTTGVAMMTLTMATRTSRGLGEHGGQGEWSVAVPVRPGAVGRSHRGAGWASHSEEALEQAEVALPFLLSHAVSLKVKDKTFLVLWTSVHR